MLGDFDRAEGQVPALKIYSSGFHLLGDIDRAEGQASVLRIYS